VKVTDNHGEGGIIRKPLKQLADVRNPERRIEPYANIVQAL
jgi:hypothetical protein